MLASRPVATFAHRLFHCGIPIFILHRIAQYGQPEAGKTSPDHLRQCLEYLLEHDYTFMSLEQLILALHRKETIPPKSIIFTIDDGYIDQAEIASPIFLEYNCPLTFFVITGMLDQTILPWDAQVSWIIETSKNRSLENCHTARDLDLQFEDKITKRHLRRSIQEAMKKLSADSIPGTLQQLASDAGVALPESTPENYRPMTWEMARQWEQQGIRFAPHSVTHNILSRLSQDKMEKEVYDAWLTIEKELSNPLKVFCYPNGQATDYGEREIEHLKNNSYLGAVATTPEFVKPENITERQIYQLPRIALPDNMTDFIQYCSWIERIRGAKQ